MTEKREQEREETQRLLERMESELRDAGFDVVKWGDGKPQRQERQERQDGGSGAE